MSHPLRLMVYDRTCHGELFGMLGLSSAWGAGSRLYAALGRFDACYGAVSWHDALTWCSTIHSGRTVDEVQYWGHGKWGAVFLSGEPLSRENFVQGGTHHTVLLGLRDRLAPHALLWLRTCEAFGAKRGQTFARVLSDFFGARVAGHTRIIGFWQSGLFGLHPGQAPHWDPAEGIREGTPEHPERAHRSGPWVRNTISCLRGDVPVRCFG